MNPYIIYFRHEGTYNKDIAQAAVTDSFLADRMTKGAKVATHTQIALQKLQEDTP